MIEVYGNLVSDSTGGCADAHILKPYVHSICFACLDARIIHLWLRVCRVRLIFNLKPEEKIDCCAAKKAHECVHEMYRFGWENSRDNENNVNHIAALCIWQNSGNFIAEKKYDMSHLTYAEPRSSPTIGISLHCLYDGEVNECVIFIYHSLFSQIGSKFWIEWGAVIHQYDTKLYNKKENMGISGLCIWK